MTSLLAALILLLIPYGAAAQPKTFQVDSANDRVLVEEHRVVLVRNKLLSKEFPERKTATVTYPIIKGLSDPSALRRVRVILRFENIFGSSLNDYRQDSWLTEFSYRVNYNRNYILDITFKQCGMGAYPDEQTKHFIINLKTGTVVKAAEAFEPDKLELLAALVDHKLRSELEQISKEWSKGGDIDAKQLEETLKPLKFDTNNLDEFSVTEKGITFLYDAGFPHVIKALEPNGRYFFSYSELKPYIKRGGVLGRFTG